MRSLLPAGAITCPKIVPFSGEVVQFEGAVSYGPWGIRDKPFDLLHGLPQRNVSPRRPFRMQHTDALRVYEDSRSSTRGKCGIRLTPGVCSRHHRQMPRTGLSRQIRKIGHQPAGVG